MLNSEQFAGPTGLVLVRRFRQAEPSWMSLGCVGSVKGKYPSKKKGHTVKKMGHMVGFDARVCELTIFVAEHNPKAQKYWEQPVLEKPAESKMDFFDKRQLFYT